MRTIDYNEYILNIKSDFYYINLAYQIKYDSTYLKKVLLNEEQHFEKFYSKHPITMFVEYLEVLVHDNILSEAEINEHFANAEIDSTLHYKRLLEYISAYEYRQTKVDFPFKLRVNVGGLKDKLKANEIYKPTNYDFVYTPYNLNAMTFEELTTSYRKSELYEKFKLSFTEYQTLTERTQKYHYQTSYEYVESKDMWILLQLLMNDGVLINNYLNKLFSRLSNILSDGFLLLLDYLDEYLFIKNTSWHKYTIDIDVDMLINKVMLYYCSLYKNIINQERFNAIFEKYNITIDYSIPIEERQQLDLFYREKYRKLCEQEEKNIK